MDAPNILGIPILSIIVFLPTVTAIVLMFLREKRAIQYVAMAGALLTFVVSVIALAFYMMTDASGRRGVESFELQEYFAWLPDLHIGWHMGVDTVSMLLIVLTTILTPISLWVSWEPIQKRVKEYYITFLILETGMLGVFVALDTLPAVAMARLAEAKLAEASGHEVAARSLYERALAEFQGLGLPREQAEARRRLAQLGPPPIGFARPPMVAIAEP